MIAKTREATEGISEIELNRRGYIQIEIGIYLNTRESIICEQEEWSEYDEAKNFDFSKHQYWITDDDGMIPKGVDTIEEAFKTLG